LLTSLDSSEGVQCRRHKPIYVLSVYNMLSTLSQRCLSLSVDHTTDCEQRDINRPLRTR